MATEDSQRILIAGGGIAGLATWRALKRKRIAATVVERSPHSADAGLAINLPGNAVAALARLGLGDEIERFGHPVRRREYRTRGDRVLASIDEDAFWGESMRPRAIRRADLMAMLGDGLDGVTKGTVGSIRQDASCVHLDLAAGGTLSGRLLVGADGVRSTVRQAVTDLGHSRAARLASASWRFMAPNPGVDGWTVWTGERGMILLLPVDAQTVYGWVAVGSPEPEGDDLDALNDAFRDFPARVRQALGWALEHPESLYHSPIEEVRLDRWSHGRVILVGDAAHATAPVWAQGAALAMEDALVLAELVATTPDEGAIGRRFEERRQSRIAHVQAMTDRLSKAARLPHAVRSLLMPFITPRSYRATYDPLKRL